MKGLNESISFQCISEFQYTAFQNDSLDPMKLKYSLINKCIQYSSVTQYSRYWKYCIYLLTLLGLAYLFEHI